jgi:hypothetical protein
MFRAAIDKALHNKVIFITLIVLLLGTSSLLIYRYAGRTTEHRCAYDGLEIDPRYEVRFALENGNFVRLSSINTAIQAFDQYENDVREILVTDEDSGRQIEAEKAYFVESRLISIPHARNRIHAFASIEAARSHRDEFSGHLITNPLSPPAIGSQSKTKESVEEILEVVLSDQKVSIHMDPFKRMPRVIKGDPLVTVVEGFGPDSFHQKDTWRILRILLRLLKDYIGVDLEKLEFKLKTMERVGDNWYVSFWQTYEGVIIYESSFGFSLDPNGGIPAIGAVLYKGLAPPNPPIRPGITLKRALEIGQDYLKTREEGEHELVAYNTIIYPVKGQTSFDYYLAYILNYDIPPQLKGATLRIGWACFVDAVSGQIIYANSIHQLASCCLPENFEQPPLYERKGVLRYEDE